MQELNKLKTKSCYIIKKHHR